MNYDYQIPLIAETIQSLRDNNKPTVLAAAVSAGKTRMTMTIIDQIIKAGEVSSVLILAHGQTVIRSNMATTAAEVEAKGLVSFKHREVTCKEDFEDWYTSPTPENVLIAIPQSLQRYGLPHFDLIIVDEAHQFFFEPMVQTIIAQSNPKYVLCLTGTPAKFVAQGYKIIAISIFELLKDKAVANPNISLGKSAYDFTSKDFTATGRLRVEERDGDLAVKFTQEQTDATMADLMAAIHQKKLYGSAPPVGVEGTFKAIGKTMIACPSQKMARQVWAYFDRNGVKASLSTSDFEEGVDIERFRHDPLSTVLIVVNRGVLGYSCPELINLVDMTCSMNMDRMMQLFGRILRIDDKNPGAAKFYPRLVPEKLIEYNYYLLGVMLSLCEHNNYVAFDGNLKKLPFRTKQFDGGLLTGTTGTESEGSDTDKPRVPLLDLGDLGLMSRVHDDSTGVYADYATTTLSDIEDRINGKNTVYPEALGILAEQLRAEKQEGKKTTDEWVSVYQRVCEANNGVFPGLLWAHRERIYGLYQVVKRRPHRFVYNPVTA
jgi:superfamily II DNA or RNA helicase